MRYNPIHLVLISSCLLLSLTFSAQAADATPRPKISFTCALPTNLPVYTELETRYRQAFAAIGYDFSMIHTSAQRAIVDANNGISDGDCARAEIVLDSIQNINLLKVDIKIATTELGVWSYNANLKINNIDDIKAAALKIGYPRGSFMPEKFMAENKLEPHLLTIDTTIAIKMLSAQRYDLLLMSSDVVNQHLPLIDLRQKIYQVGVLAVHDVYPLIHIKHKTILPQFTAELRKLVAPEGIPVEGRTTNSN